MTKPTRKERENARHRREILDVAVLLFAENGYHETTMQMIADAAEFSVGYLYKHFAGKEEMYQEMVEYHVGVMDTVLAETEARGLSPLEELRANYEAVCEHFNHHRDFMRIYHQRIESDVTALADRKKEQFEKTIIIFDRAVEAGELVPADTRILATVLHGASQELFHELAEKDVDRPFDSLTETVFSLIIDPQRKT